MPIRKLWNALRGQADIPPVALERGSSGTSSSSSPEPGGVQSPDVSGSAEPPRVASPQRQASRPSRRGSDGGLSADVAASTTEPRSRPVKIESAVKRGLLGGRQLSAEQKAVVKLVRSVGARSVLEIGVGDGSRAGVVLETLQSSAPENAPLRYLAIDEFELGDGPVTMRQFNQSLRSQNVRPQIFPEPIGRGMTRVAHTFGAVDLILIGVSPESWAAAECESLLRKIAHTETVVLDRHDGQWKSRTVEAAEIPAAKRHDTRRDQRSAA